MKKPAIILFAIFYLISVTGFSMDMHWCGKKVRLVSINSSHETKCPCGKKMPSGCCKDVHVKVKLNENQKTSSTLSVPKITEAKYFFNTILPESPVLLSQQKLFSNTCYHAPPPKEKQPAYVTNCVFLI